MNRSHKHVALVLLLCSCVGCSSRNDPDADAEIPVPTEDAGLAPISQDEPDASAPGPDSAAIGPTTQPLTVVRPDASPGLIEPPRISTYTLKERYRIGLRVRREVQVARRYHLRVESDLVGSAEGASEITREYVVHVDDALRGQIRGATIDVLADHLRVLPVGDSRPRLAVELGPLHGAQLRCQITGEDRYACDGRDTALSADMMGVYPQRFELLPAAATAIGESWSLVGAESNRFLGASAGDTLIQFLLEDSEHSFRGESCYRVVYTLGGTQPMQVLGSTLEASLTGGGEYYYCRSDALVLYHRQERSLTVNGAIQRGSRRIPVERTEEFVLEVQSFIAGSGP